MVEISIQKSKLSSGSEHTDFAQIRKDVQMNLVRVQRHYWKALRKSNVKMLRPKAFTIDGGLVSSQDVFEAYAPDYFRRSRRVVFHKDRVHYRGGRYTISSNPTFELRQKLETFMVDLDEGLGALENEKHPFFQVAIADYVKNSVLTMFNSFLHEEKVGKYRFGDLSYQAIRKDGQSYAQAAVDLFYGILLHGENLTSIAYKYLKCERKTFVKIQEHILEEYKKGTFSSRHVTRPEATHPLVISAAVGKYVIDGSKKLDTIVGLPSGSTELALAHGTAQRIFNNQRNDVLLFPVSLHSSKLEFDANKLTGTDVSRWAKHYRNKLEDNTVLIVDDNSSTGRTIEVVSKALSTVKPRVLEIAIAEADIVRTEIDLPHNERGTVANRSLYRHSVNVLPVSRIVSPKRDLKEIFERAKMSSCIMHRYENSECDLPRRIVGQVYQSLLTDKTENVLAQLEPSETHTHFRKTFLSNFYPVDILLGGNKYVSVEHAYQAMKFEPNIWDIISDQDVKLINRKLAGRGAKISREELPNLFTDSRITAGTSKTVGNNLRILGYVRADWDDVKIDIMVQLLVQKFSVQELFDQLQQTGRKYLVEGNDWNDTYWGYSNGRGRNVLGRMLMALRDIDISELREAADQMRNTEFDHGLPLFSSKTGSSGSQSQAV